MMRYYIRKELVVNNWLNDGHLNYFAVDADTGVRIVGTDGATAEDAAWFAEHWNHGAREVKDDKPPAAPEPPRSMPYTIGWAKCGDS